MFNRAVIKGYIENNPVQFVETAKIRNERDRILESNEYIRLLAASPEPLRSIIITAYETGMRKGEILNLTWDKVDFKKGFIRLLPSDTKTKEKRIIPVSDTLMNVLKKLKKEDKNNKYVFTRKGIRVKSIRESFKNACKKAGLKDFVFHDLRHTFITNMVNRGVDPFNLMAMTGHRDIKMLKRYYTVQEAELKKIVLGKRLKMNTNMDTKISGSILAFENILNS